MTTFNAAINDSTLDPHLQSMLDALHGLQKARKAETLTHETYNATLKTLAANYTRDFPAVAASRVTESSAEDLLAGYLERLSARNVASPTGLKGLDSALNGGFQAKRLVTLLGAPGGGKTSLANQWSEQVASERPVLYATSEDTPDVLVAKTLSRIGGVDYGAVLYGRDIEGIRRAMKLYAERPSAKLLHYLDVTSGMITLDELRDRAKAHFDGKPGPGLIVVDYLQRMARAIRDSAGTRELREAVTQLTEQLRAIACELDCTVLAIASMNRASGYGKNGESSALSSAKESGDIEYSSDVLMALTEDPKAEMRMASVNVVPRLLKIDKNRQGPVTAIKLAWRGERQEFYPMEEEV